VKRQRWRDQAGGGGGGGRFGWPGGGGLGWCGFLLGGFFLLVWVAGRVVRGGGGLPFFRPFFFFLFRFRWDVVSGANLYSSRSSEVATHPSSVRAILLQLLAVGLTLLILLGCLLIARLDVPLHFEVGEDSWRSARSSRLSARTSLQYRRRNDGITHVVSFHASCAGRFQRDVPCADACES